MVGFMLGMRGIGGGFARLGSMTHIEDRQRNLDADSEVVVLKVRVVEIVVVELRKAVVLGREGDLRSPQVARIAKGNLALGFGRGIGRCDRRTAGQGGVRIDQPMAR